MKNCKKFIILLVSLFIYICINVVYMDGPVYLGYYAIGIVEIILVIIVILILIIHIRDWVRDKKNTIFNIVILVTAIIITFMFLYSVIIWRIFI